MIRST